VKLRVPAKVVHNPLIGGPYLWGWGVCALQLPMMTVTGVLRALCAAQRWEEALQLLCRMDEIFVKPEATSASFAPIFFWEEPGEALGWVNFS